MDSFEIRFQKIIQETQSTVLSAIGKYLPDEMHHAIDDAAQETYFRAYRRLKQIDIDSIDSIHAYLYVVARHVCQTMSRKYLREKNRSVEIDSSPMELKSPNTEKEMEGKAILSEVKDRIEKLPLKYRPILAMIMQGFNEREISETLELKQGTVKSRLHRGRRVLKKLMEEDIG